MRASLYREGPGRTAGRRTLTGFVCLAAGWSALAAPAMASAVGSSPGGQDQTRSVIVMTQPGELAAAESQARRLGAVVGREISLISGFTARLTPAAADRLARSAAVRSVAADRSGRLLSVDPALGYDPVADFGSANQISKVLGAQTAWKAGWTGKGIDVALIDSGVAAVPGLASGNVVNGPDLSFDSQDSTLTQRDNYGHGTHMAGLIAGRDSAQSSGAGYVTASAKQFVGMAPDARVVSVKVGANDGAVDVSQVIAGIDWVVQHAHDPGLNIRVLNLSFGTNSTQPYVQDPLAYAAEQAWKHGIVVAVAAGNDGSSTTTSLADPAYDPYLLAVGASDPNGTVSPSNDTVAPFANHGTAGRPVDLVAPGVHVLGLRAPDSSLDVAYPTARVGTRFFRGSGTSQATALVSGAAAVLLQKFPAATPDQIKNLLQMSAYNFSAPANYRGAGSVDLAAAIARKLSTNGQGNTGGSTGDGSLDLSRGDSFVNDGTADLRGEVDIFGTPFSSAAIAAAETSASSWTGATWNGNDWTGVDWTGTGGSWAGRTWTGRTWTGRTWTGRTWTGRTWTGRTWTSASWS